MALFGTIGLVFSKHSQLLNSSGVEACAAPTSIFVSGNLPNPSLSHVKGKLLKESAPNLPNIFRSSFLKEALISNIKDYLTNQVGL